MNKFLDMPLVSTQVKNFSEYIKLYLEDNDAINDIDKDTISLVDEKTNARWQVAIAPSHKGFQQMSFVNSIATTKVESIVSLELSPVYLPSARRVSELLDVLVA